MSRRAQKSQKNPTQQQADNERQFRCKCLKTYKSYPALYTHIKNKHPNNMEEYKVESKRPKEYEIDKGRPKKHGARPLQADEQGDLLNIIELGVLQIEEVLKGKIYSEENGSTKKFEILTGNKRIQFEELRGHYMLEKQQMIEKIRELCGQEQQGNSIIEELNVRDLSSLRNEAPVKVYKEEIRFRHQLVQHFNAITAAKILIQLELLEIVENNRTITINQNQGITLNQNDNDNDNNNGINFSTDMKSIIRLCEESLWGQKQQKNNIAKTIETIRNTWNSKINKINNLPYIKNHESSSSQQSSQEKQGSKQREQSLNHSIPEQPQNEHQQAQLMDCINTEYYQDL